MKQISYVIIACYIDKGMKSKGSKCLMEFNNIKLLDYQISQIAKNHKNTKDYEIILINDFEYTKIEKYFGNKIKVIPQNKKINPVAQGCICSKYKDIVFIDYGCIFTYETLLKINTGISAVFTSKSNTTLGSDSIGAIINQNSSIEHLFYDLNTNYFVNIFYLTTNDTSKILAYTDIHRFNLMYFEVINYLIASGSKIDNKLILNNNYIYFNNMEQKNDIVKFIKKHTIN